MVACTRPEVCRPACARTGVCHSVSAYLQQVRRSVSALSRGLQQRLPRGPPTRQRPPRGLPLAQRPPREPVLSTPPHRRRDVKWLCPTARPYQRQPRVSSMCLRNEVRPQTKSVYQACCHSADGSMLVTSEAFEARPKTPAPQSRELTLARPPLQGEIMPPPKSMIADGGAPPRRYPAGASIAEATALIRAPMLAEQACVNAARWLDGLRQLERFTSRIKNGTKPPKWREVATEAARDCGSTSSDLNHCKALQLAVRLSAYLIRWCRSGPFRMDLSRGLLANRNLPPFQVFQGAHRATSYRRAASSITHGFEGETRLLFSMSVSAGNR